MRFEIVARRSGVEKSESYTYDNEDNAVFDASGELLDFGAIEKFRAVPKPKRIDIVPVMSHDKPLVGKDSLLSVLKIQLGLQCNYHCTYCLQAEWRNLVKTPKQQDIVDFMATLEKAGIEIAPKGHIELWGGEPLVYVKALKVLIPLLHKRFKVPISMITNGALLTRDLVDFFFSYGVRLSISHDGPGFELRDGKNPLFDSKIRDVWLYAHSQSKALNVPFRFHVVISPKNSNLFEIRDYFRKNFARDVDLSFEGIVSNTGVGDSTAFSQEDACQLNQSLFNALLEEPEKWPMLEVFAQGLTRKLVYRVPVHTFAGRCNQVEKNVLATDLFGHVVACQNRPAMFFGIGELTNLPAVTNNVMTHWSNREHCRKCLVLNSCKGHCPLLTDAQSRTACHNEFIFHMAVFAVVWFRLTGTLIESATPRP